MGKHHAKIFKGYGDDPDREINGKLKPGNKYSPRPGQFRGSKPLGSKSEKIIAEIDLFKEARKQVEIEKKLKLYVYTIRRAYDSDKVLVAIIRRLLPESIELSDDTKKLLEEELLRRKKSRELSRKKKKEDEKEEEE